LYFWNKEQRQGGVVGELAGYKQGRSLAREKNHITCIIYPSAKNHGNDLIYLAQEDIPDLLQGCLPNVYNRAWEPESSWSHQ
jgi:hypothetical protein